MARAADDGLLAIASTGRAPDSAVGAPTGCAWRCASAPCGLPAPGRAGGASPTERRAATFGHVSNLVRLPPETSRRSIAFSTPMVNRRSGVSDAAVTVATGVSCGASRRPTIAFLCSRWVLVQACTSPGDRAVLLPACGGIIGRVAAFQLAGSWAERRLWSAGLSIPWAASDAVSSAVGSRGALGELRPSPPALASHAVTRTPRVRRSRRVPPRAQRARRPHPAPPCRRPRSNGTSREAGGTGGGHPGGARRPARHHLTRRRPSRVPAATLSQHGSPSWQPMAKACSNDTAASSTFLLQVDLGQQRLGPRQESVPSGVPRDSDRTLEFLPRAPSSSRRSARRPRNDRTQASARVARAARACSAPSLTDRGHPCGRPCRSAPPRAPPGSRHAPHCRDPRALPLQRARPRLGRIGHAGAPRSRAPGERSPATCASPPASAASIA